MIDVLYNIDENENYTTWTSDVSWNWWYSPGSQISIVWKNGRDFLDDNINYNWIDNANQTLNSSKQNSISFKIVYYLDYLYLRNDKINNLYHSYDNIKVLDGINLEINKSEIISVLGKSGAGKTTLLNLIGTLDTIQDGEIFINRKLINNLSLKELYKLRNEEIGFVFQFHNLLPEFTALENICLPAFIKGITKKEAEKKAYELLKKLDLTNRAQHKPNQLSGGEKQKNFNL